jgi:hypothetical protein
MAKIGIKLANGTFYPILDEYSATGKKLTLTAARNGQSSAQIDFYRSNVSSMKAAQYIGSLVVDFLARKKDGEYSINLTVTSTADGRVLVEAREARGTSGTQKLEIALDSFNADADTGMTGGGLYAVTGRNAGISEAKKRPVNPVVPVVIAAVLFLIAALVFLFLFLSQGFPPPVNVYESPPAREEAAAATPPAPSVREAARAFPSVPPTALPDDLLEGADTSPQARRAETGEKASGDSRKALRTETAR